MLESKFKKQFRAYLTLRGFRIHPIENKIVAGMPDLLVIFPTGVIWIELKTLTTISGSQIAWIKRHPEETVLMARYTQNHDRLIIGRWLKDGTVGGWGRLYEGKWNVESEVVAEIINKQQPPPAGTRKGEQNQPH